MGRTYHGLIGSKLQGARWNSADKKDSKGSKANTGLNEYVPKALVKKSK